MRIIAGEAKGREITAPKGMHTRPTLAKVKEAMFGMVQFDIPGAVVLDLFSGSGSLGMEAISRGAQKAVFCDSDRQAYAIINANIKKLGFESRASVTFGDSLLLLKRLAMEGKRFDIVFLDPPYETDLESRAVRLLDEYGLLNEGAIVMCEHSASNPPVFTAAYSVKKERKYGDCYVTPAVYEGAKQV